jgi:hypothetical protein
MAQELKHVGRVKATGKRCLVAYRTLPGDAHNCLIVPTETLSDSYHNAIVNLVESPSGQGAYEFAEAMARTQFPDGSTMLAALHKQGRLVKIATDLVEMCPTPGVAVMLSELNQIIAEQRGVAVDDLSLKSELAPKKDAKSEVKEVAKVTETAKPAAEDFTRTSSASVNTPEVVAPEGTAEDQAKFYRSQADALAKQAAAMRRKAEELVPTKKAK